MNLCKSVKSVLHQIKSYLQFLWHSKNQHGVHSPFVFDLVTKCFYDKNDYPEYKTLKEYRNSLLQNKNTIEVTDFGSGSRVFKSNTRQIAKIAKTAGITPKRAKLLFRIVNYFQPSTILEIGTSLGLATSALSLGNQKAKITTLEGCPKTSTIAKIQSQKFNCNKYTHSIINWVRRIRRSQHNPGNLKFRYVRGTTYTHSIFRWSNNGLKNKMTMQSKAAHGCGNGMSCSVLIYR